MPSVELNHFTTMLLKILANKNLVKKKLMLINNYKSKIIFEINTNKLTKVIKFQ